MTMDFPGGIRYDEGRQLFKIRRIGKMCIRDRFLCAADQPSPSLRSYKRAISFCKEAEHVHSFVPVSYTHLANVKAIFPF